LLVLNGASVPGSMSAKDRLVHRQGADVQSAEQSPWFIAVCDPVPRNFAADKDITPRNFKPWRSHAFRRMRRGQTAAKANNSHVEKWQRRCNPTHPMMREIITLQCVLGYVCPIFRARLVGMMFVERAMASGRERLALASSTILPVCRNRCNS